MAEGTGHPFGASGSPNNGASFLHTSMQVFQDQKEVDDNKIDYKGVTPGLKPGDMKFKDVDGNARSTAMTGAAEQDAGPYFQPVGVNLRVGWKNFDLSVLFPGCDRRIALYRDRVG